MLENETMKYSVRIDPIDIRPGLRQKIDEFEKLVEPQFSVGDLVKKIAERFEKRFCGVCFFGSVVGNVEGVPLCRDCLVNMYETVEQNGVPMPTKRSDRYEWHIRQRRADAFEYMWKIGHENAFLRTRLDELGVDSYNEIRTKLYGLEPL